MESNRHSGEIGGHSAAVGIYIHVPFCEKKCFYCDFYSVENQSQQKAFLSSLVKEIKLSSENLSQRYEADTIFFGGGTPSLLSPAEIGSILETLHKHFDISAEAEFTVECNPGTVTEESLSGYRHLGVNRLSFGVQSFFDDELKFLSRIHDSRQAVEALMLARKCGFENINLDLIYGIPGQSIDRVATNLEKAVALNPAHISAYNLIVEPGTPLFSSVASGQVKPLDESIEAEMYQLTMSFLEENGYEHYEISNYSRPGFQCRHNLKYWNCEEYLSFGPSAHSFLNKTRWWNVSSLGKYISELSENRLPVSAKEKLTENQLIDEFVMLQLRQGKIDLKDLDEKFKIRLDPCFILDLKKNGYAELSDHKILLTRSGYTVCDEIAEEMLSSNLAKVSETSQA
ncbi:MAG TPA: radical SAM family heme chaperone HemW [Candidatus Acidoferrales bacterium]|nr:radical SAM family heme chaperone HemW [Candidatus Acidoferrales bacterium]